MSGVNNEDVRAPREQIEGQLIKIVTDSMVNSNKWRKLNKQNSQWLLLLPAEVVAVIYIISNSFRIPIYYIYPPHLRVIKVELKRRHALWYYLTGL